MMISLFLHSLGREALSTMERERKKRNFFAIGKKMKEILFFQFIFKKDTMKFICNRECVDFNSLKR